jgi:DNA-binding LacI/PurR family transcriptional regulator
MNPLGRPSVLDVARECGVSPSTVCRALNRGSDVAADTRAQVLAVCARLGYAKNTAASTLRRRGARVIAALMPDQDNELFVQKLFFLKQAVVQAGYGWYLANYRDESEAEGCLRELLGLAPAGVLLSGPVASGLPALLTRNRVAAVGYDADVPELDGVALDREAGSLTAVRHLLAAGRRRVLLLGASADSERGRGYVRAHEQVGCAVVPELVQAAAFGRDLFVYGHEQCRRLLERTTFDAVYAINDACAIGAMRALFEQGIRVPEEVAVIGFDGIMAAAYTVPALTSVEQPKEKMAEHAIAFLCRRLTEPATPRQFIRLVPELRLRESG